MGAGRSREVRVVAQYADLGFYISGVSWIYLTFDVEGGVTLPLFSVLYIYI